MKRGGRLLLVTTASGKVLFMPIFHLAKCDIFLKAKLPLTGTILLCCSFHFLNTKFYDEAVYPHKNQQENLKTPHDISCRNTNLRQSNRHKERNIVE